LALTTDSQKDALVRQVCKLGDRQKRAAPPSGNPALIVVNSSALDVAMTAGAATDDLHRVLALEIDTGAEGLVAFDMMAASVCTTHLRLRRDCRSDSNTSQSDHQYDPCHMLLHGGQSAGRVYEGAQRKTAFISRIAARNFRLLDPVPLGIAQVHCLFADAH
jgi:hypothetical protein